MPQLDFSKIGEPCERLARASVNAIVSEIGTNMCVLVIIAGPPTPGRHAPFTVASSSNVGRDGAAEIFTHVLAHLEKTTL